MKDPENYTLQNNIVRIKADIHSNNLALLGMFEKFEQTQCRKAYFRSKPKRIYEKVVETNKKNNQNITLLEV